jgi:hypothetical protein
MDIGHIKIDHTPTIYDSVSCSENIITKLVNSFNNNITYTKYVKTLSDSDDIKNQKIALKINRTLTEIKVFNTKSNPLFLASDIGILLGLSNINTMIKKFDESEMIEGFIIKNNKEKRVLFLTNHGLKRCFVTSTKSPLALLLKTFCYDLLDHMLENEPETTKKIATKLLINNSEMFDAGMTDLSNKLINLESKYIDEQKKSSRLECLYNNEQTKRIELQEQTNKVEIINSYNTMYIEQLKKEKEAHLNTIKNINETISYNENTSIDTIELRLLKEKFMKPLYIYILHPDYFNKLLINKKKQLKLDASIITESSEYDSDVVIKNSDNEYDSDVVIKKPVIKNLISQKKDSIVLIEHLLKDATYKKNFENIFNKNEVCIDSDEILYFCFGYGRNVAKKDKLILVTIQWVANKKHHLNTLNSLSNSCDMLFNTFIKLPLYKSSLDEINDIIKEEFINL